MRKAYPVVILAAAALILSMLGCASSDPFGPDCHIYSTGTVGDCAPEYDKTIVTG